MRIAAAALAALLLAACGSSHARRPAATAQTLTKAQFIARADNACRKVQASGARAIAIIPGLEASLSPRRVKVAASALRQYFSSARIATNEIRELRAPAADEKQIKLLLTTYDEEARLGGELAKAVERGERGRRKELGAAIAVLVRFVHEIAHAYGLQVCGA
jgi:hypothetical protein